MASRPTRGICDDVVDVAFLGSSVTYRVDVGGAELRVHDIGREIKPRFAVGERVAVLYEPNRCALLGESSGETTKEE